MRQCIKQNYPLFFVSIVIGIIYAVGSVVSAKILEEVLDTSLAGDLGAFREALVFAVGYLVAFGFLSYLYGRVNNQLVNHMNRDYRQAIYSGLMKMDYRTFHGANSAEYLSALTNDIKMVEENYVVSMIDTIQYLFVLVATMFMLFSLSVKVAVALIVSVLLMLVIPSALGKSLQKRQDVVSESLKKLTEKTKDILSGFEVIKSFHVFVHFQNVFERENAEVTRAKVASDNLLELNKSLSEILGALCQFVVVFFSAYLIIKGEITAGTSLALLQLSGNFIMPIVTILTNLPKMQGIEPIIKKLDSYCGQEAKAVGDMSTIRFEKCVEVKDVSFSYEEGVPILRDIDLSIQKGGKYVISGKSGCGKSTLAKLLSGYYDTYGGSIEYDGTSIKECDVQASANLISTIHQNVYMFDTDIENNITLYDKYSSAEIQDALDRSGVAKFVSEFPDGIHSPVGENGNKLSGGQRQRIAIARALIRNMPIMVLDEGTSAIDQQTAYEIENQLLDMKELTLLTITHNLDPNLRSKYDEIIRMDEGRIARA